MPTLVLPSPTATSALNENRRPPLTTLATRLMAITFSTWSLWWSRSPRSRRGPPRPPAARPAAATAASAARPVAAARALAAGRPLAAGRRSAARGLPGAGLAAACAPASVGSRLPFRTPIRLRARRRRRPARDHGNGSRRGRTPPGDSRRLRLLRQQLADRLAAGHLARAVDLDALARVAHAQQRHAEVVVDELGVDVLERAEDDQPRPLGRAGHLAGGPADGGGSAAGCGSSAREWCAWLTWLLSCRPCGGPARPGSGCPCPCRARAAAPREARRPPGRRAPCRRLRSSRPCCSRPRS